MTRLSLPDLSERDRRTLMLGVGVIAALLFTFRGVPVWRSWVRESRAAAVELTDRLALARAGARGRSMLGLSDSLATMYGIVTSALLRGDTPAQAGATLASYVAEQAKTVDVELGAVQLSIDSTTPSDPVYRARVRTEITGDVHGVVYLLHTLESSTAPLLAVRSLTVSALEPAAPANRPEVLRVSLEVEGLARQMVQR